MTKSQASWDQLRAVFSFVPNRRGYLTSSEKTLMYEVSMQNKESPEQHLHMARDFDHHCYLTLTPCRLPHHPLALMQACLDSFYLPVRELA